MDKSTIIDRYRLSFDGGDPLNGSLYIGDDLAQQPGVNVELLIDELRAAGLWSDDAAKFVPDEHREAYKAQLALQEVVEYRDADAQFFIVRFDHEKYPSSDERWRAWVTHFDSRFRRAN